MLNRLGDSLKRVHWKLSARKRELVVRRFEEPVLPEALVLMDCSPPPSWGHPEAEADVRDSLLETAASVMNSQMITDHAVRLPLLGKQHQYSSKHRKYHKKAGPAYIFLSTCHKSSPSYLRPNLFHRLL